MRGARVGEEVGVAGGDDAVDDAARPAWRWSGCRRYCFHGSWPSTTSGRAARIDRAHLLARCRGRPSSSPSTAPRKCTSRGTERSGPRPVARRWRVATSAARSLVGIPGALRAVGEHEQLHVGAGAAHLASVAPHPNSMSSGWAPIASTRGGHADVGVVTTCGAASRSAAELDQVVGDVDVEREVAVAHDAQPEPEPAGLGRVTAERAGSVGEAELDVGRDREHRGAVVAVARARARRPAARRRARAGRASRRAGDRRGRRRHGRSPRRAQVVASGGGGARRGCRDRRARSSAGRRPSRARRDRTTRRRRAAAPAACTTCSAQSPGRARRARRRSSAAARRALPSAKARIGMTTPAWPGRRGDARCGRSRGTSVHVCYRPWSPQRPWPSIGAGSWGTTVAAIMSEHAPTTLWGRDPELVDEIARAARELALPRAASRCRTRCAPPTTSTPRARAPTWW